MKQEKKYYAWILFIIVLLVCNMISCVEPEIRLNLTFHVQGNGRTDPTGTVVVNMDEPLSITAIPDTGHHFSGWETIDGSGVVFGNIADASTTVTLTSTNATIRANFSLNECLLTLTTSGNGSTIPEEDIVHTVNYAEAVSISAIPDAEWNFTGWTVISGTCSFGSIIESDTTVIVTSSSAEIRANFSDSNIPDGYDVAIIPVVADLIDDELSFTYSGAEIGTTYHYSIDDPANGSTIPVTGSGTVLQSSATVSDIDVSSLDDSLLTLTFYLTDSEGNDGSNVYDSVTKDTAIPSFVSVSASGDEIYMDGETITFTLNMGETGLTVTADLSVLDSSFSATQALTDNNDNTYSCTTPILNSATANEGTGIDITFTAADPLGHENTNSSLSVTLDFTPPTGSFYIDSMDDPADVYTLTTAVTLNLSISGATQMCFGNSVTERNAAAWETYSGSKAWTLSSGVDEKTVFGAFRDTAGNVFLMTDTIIYMKKLKASNGALNDNYGKSVSVSSDGSNVAVGADGDNSSAGSVYGYKGSAWGTEYNRTYSSVVAGDLLGKSVALSADNSTLVVGSSGVDTQQGSILIFYDTNWSLVRRILRSPRVDGDNFGCSVSVSSDGDKVATGAFGVNSNTGAVYVYDYNGTTWLLGATLTASDGAGSDEFGYSIAISADGSTVVVGAPGTDNNQGRVYVFNGSNWGTEAAKFTSSDGASLDSFGSSIAVSSDGSIIVVGAYGDNSTTGAVYVYSGSNWGTQTKLTASDGETGDYYGISVGISADGSIIVVGSSRDDDNGTYAGAAYVYSDTSWSTETKHTAFDGAMIDYFGASVSVSADGSTLVVGSYGDDDNGSASGSVYILPPLHNLE